MKHKPLKNDKVQNPYSGLEMEDGSIIPKYGIIKKIKNGICYVDFYIDGLEEIYIKDMIKENGIWLDKYEV